MTISKDKTHSPSRFPKPLDVAQPQELQGSASEGSAVDYRALARTLLARFGVVLTDADRAWYLDELTDEQAARLGAGMDAHGLVQDVCAAFDTYAPWIAAGRVTGYGPGRAACAVEIVLTAAPRLAEHRALTELDGAPAALVPTLSPVERRKVLRAARRVIQRRPTAAAAVQQTLAAHAPAVKRVAEQRRVNAEVAWVRAHVPANVRLDLGLTDARLDALQSATREAVAAADAKRAKRQSRQMLRDDLSVPCGRLLYELRELLQAAEAARSTHAKIPAFTSRFLARGSRRKDAAPIPAPIP